MKRVAFFFVGFCLTAVIAMAQQPVSVYDIAVQPDSTNKKVTVQYRLANTQSGYATVGMEISSNAGVSWDVASDTFYPDSDVGAGVSADGTLRQLVWDARADWNNQYSTQMIVRLNATTVELGSLIYFAFGTAFYQMDLDGSNIIQIEALPDGLESFIADVENNRLLCLTWDGLIYTYDVINGGQWQSFLDGIGSGGQGFAYDPGNNRYYAGRYYNGVYRLDASESGTWQQIVTSSQISPLLGQRGQISIDTVNDHIYFRTAYNGYCNNCRDIYRVDPDGSNLTSVVPTEVGEAVVIDAESGYIYFSDGENWKAGTGKIMRANLDGSDLQMLTTYPAPYVACQSIELDKEGGKMYMFLTDTITYGERAIACANLDGSGFELLFNQQQTTTGGYGLALFLRQ